MFLGLANFPIEIHPDPHYGWYPQVLANVSHSAHYLSKELRSHIGQTVDHSNSLEDDESRKADLADYINTELIQKGLGIQDATPEEIQRVIDIPELSSYTFADMVSRRAQIGWSTHGHSAVDVNIYGSKGSDALRGNHENIEVGKFLRNYLDVDIQAVTDELIEKSITLQASARYGNWFGSIPTEEEIESTLRHYERLYPEYS